MARREILLPWKCVPQQAVVRSARFPDAQIFLPGLPTDLDGRFPVTLNATDAAGIIVDSPNGPSWASAVQHDFGWDVGASDGTWDGGLVVMGRTGNVTPTNETICTSGGGLHVQTTQIRLVSSSSARVTVPLSSPLEPHEHIFFYGKNGEYRVYVRGEKHGTGTLTYGHNKINGIMKGLLNSVAMLVRFPNWDEQRDEDIWSLVNDPFQVFAPRRVYVPVYGAASSAPVLSAATVFAITDTQVTPRVTITF
jgi:hypothetical protein